MLRLGKLSDYGIRILAHLARDAGDEPRNAREVAEQMGLPAPAVSKVMKSLARGGVIESQRGAKGGYTLARRPEELTVAEMITALEGPLAMTECAVAPQLCQHETQCAVKGPWQVINEVIQGALEGVTLADLIDPQFTSASTALRLLQEPGARLESADTIPRA